MSRITVARYGLAVAITSREPNFDGVHGVWAREDAIGSLAVEG